MPLASPAFIRGHRLKRPDQLLGVALIQSNVSIVQWSDWFAAHSDQHAPDRFTLRFDRAHMWLDAATQGRGVALESATMAGQHLADGRPRGARLSASAWPPRRSRRATALPARAARA
jgi:LysR family glycine cleavage system transcriptional activator